LLTAILQWSIGPVVQASLDAPKRQQAAALHIGSASSQSVVVPASSCAGLCIGDGRAACFRRRDWLIVNPSESGTRQARPRGGGRPHPQATKGAGNRNTMQANETKFQGDKKEPIISPLAGIERIFIQSNVKRVPHWLGSHHLTMMTVLWSAGVVLAGWLATRNVAWLWLSSLMIFMQWLTDSFDGAVGRSRHQGLKRWGFYMDHYLDYVFMACVTGHYAFMMPQPAATLFLLLIPLYAGFEVNSWLEFGATGQFRITYNGIGPTEVRLLFIAINTIIIFGGGPFIAHYLLVPLMLLMVLMLVITVWQSQKRVWALDMEAIAREKEEHAKKDAE
jgi:phosphatidylglycerophosphate synthase